MSDPTTPPHILSRAVDSPPPAVRLAAASGIPPPIASFRPSQPNKWRLPGPSPPLRTSVLPKRHETLHFAEEHPGKVPGRAVPRRSEKVAVWSGRAGRFRGSFPSPAPAGLPPKGRCRSTPRLSISSASVRGRGTTSGCQSSLQSVYFKNNFMSSIIFLLFLTMVLCYTPTITCRERCNEPRLYSEWLPCRTRPLSSSK